MYSPIFREVESRCGLEDMRKEKKNKNILVIGDPLYQNVQ